LSEEPSIASARSRTITQLRYPLPYPGLSFDKHLELVKAYSVLSKEGKDSVTYKDVGKTISPFKVSGNTKFFENVGILAKVQGKGRYKPTEEAIDIYRDLVWKKETDVKLKVRALVLRSWFWETTKNLLTIRGKIPEEDLIQQLGREAGAEPRIHTPSLRILISYIKFAGLLVEQDGQIALSSDIGLTSPPSSEGPGDLSKETIATSNEVGQKASVFGKNPVVLGVLIQADTPEDQIRRAVRIVLEETARAENQRGTTQA
jgi:hypothetical protein